MRVVSGKYRALTLAEFEGEEIRPTADRVKESLFNILSPRIARSTVLDLFCGSGSLGIECISRGAEHVYFNDISLSSLGVLGKNLAKLKGESGYTITHSDYQAYLKAAKCKFDIIFIDPPYRLDFGVPALEIIARRGLLEEDGVAVYEHDMKFYGSVAGLEFFDERKYGKTYLSFFRPVRASAVLKKR